MLRSKVESPGDGISGDAMKLSLSIRLTGAFLLAVGTTSVISAVIGAWMIRKGVYEQGLNKAKQDINAARLIYRQAMGEVQDRVRVISLGPGIPEALQRPDSIEGLRLLKQREGLDFLTFTGADGRVLLRAHSKARERSEAGRKIVRPLLGSSQAVAATLVMTREDLRLENPTLVERAGVALLPLSEASYGLQSKKTTGRALQTSGLVLLAAIGVRGEDGRLLGAVYGGRLLNRTVGIVDLIRQTIYRGEVYHGREVGEATICLGDVRIATNLRTANNLRAIGTRVEPAVRDYVIYRGGSWVQEALVLNERHITAYEPIRDLADRVVGILAVGIPERKYTEMQREALLVFFGITLGGVLLAVGIATFVSRRITRSIRGIVLAVRELAAGNLDRQVEPDPGIREFSQVGEGFNKLAASLKERDLQLKYRTQEQIGKSERLAMIGRLAAGVAHEINNPLGGIMLFGNLLLRKLPTEGAARENAERICNEARRCQKIVQGLLEFARHREPKVEPVDIHDVLDKTLQLVENQAMFLNIKTVREYQKGLPHVRLDPAQMEQVLINLIFNAAEAMKSKGKLTITTQAIERGEAVRISVSDTGCGISSANLEHLFEPFFTTKGVGEGTGLGLSISRGIIENHGGTIWATSNVGEGTTFFIRLPAISPG